VRTWTAIGGLAAALGPVIGGLLVTVSWRWIFIINVPIGLVAMLVGWWKLPEILGHEAPRPNPFDAALVTGGIGALTFAIVKVNDWGWVSPGIGLSFAAAVILIALFVWRCLRLPNPFVDPALFHIRPFTGAALVMAPYSAAFGAALLSVALWEQTAWGWSALKTGLAIAPGPLLVPITSLLLAGRLIVRFGAAPVITAGILFFAAGLICWAGVIGFEPSATLVVMGMIPIGIGVGLTFPTLMGVSASGLPPSSFATGSGVINMIRQASLAVGVAILRRRHRLAGIARGARRRFSSGIVGDGRGRRAWIDSDLFLYPAKAYVSEHFHRHCERSEAIQNSSAEIVWIALSLRSSQ